MGIVSKRICRSGRGKKCCLGNTVPARSLVALSVIFSTVTFAQSPSLEQADTVSIDQRISEIVAVELNGIPLSQGLLIARQGKGVWIPRSFLIEHRLFSLDRTKPEPFDRYVKLSSLEHLSYRIDPVKQLLEIKATSKAFTATVIESRNPTIADPMPSLFTFFGNYNATAIKSGNRERVNALLEFGVTLENSALINQVLLNDISQDRKSIRLETAWVKDFPAARARLTVGDAVSIAAAGGELASSYRFGGLQWGTRFEIEPDFVSYPVPKVFGEAATQSTVDLYVNESLRLRTEAEAGPFAIDRPPLSNGAGEIQLVVKDLTGREQVFVSPFYVSTRLLAKNTVDYEVNIGRLRENFSITSNDYGERFLAARYRRGLTNNFSAEALAEWSQSHRLVGGAGLLALPSIGLMSLSAQASDSPEGPGSVVGASLERQSSRVSFGIRGRRFSNTFKQLGSGVRDRNVISDWTGSVRYSPQFGGSASLIYSDRQFDDSTFSEILSIAFSRRLGLSTNVTLSGSLIQGRSLSGSNASLENFEDYNINLSVSRGFGQNYSGGSNVNVKGKRQPDASEVVRTSMNFRKSAPRDLGYGYRVNLNHDDRSDSLSGNAALDVSTLGSVWRLSATRSQNSSTLSANTQGSFVVAKKNLFLQRPLRTGFAVIDLKGHSGVGVYRENQLTTRSNRDGYAVVTELRPYSKNYISLETADLPISASMKTDRSVVVPYFRGGVLLDFGVLEGRSALVTLTTVDGQVMPIGTQVVSRESGQISYVAQRGEVFLEGLVGESIFDIFQLDKSCTINIREEAFDENTTQRFGPVQCDLQ